MKFCTVHMSGLRKCQFKWALSTPTSYSVPTTSRNSITTLSTLSSHTTYVWPTDTKLTTWGRCTTQRENSNIYMCMPNHRGFRLRRTLHVVFANKTIDRGLCGRAFWSNPHTAIEQNLNPAHTCMWKITNRMVSCGKKYFWAQIFWHMLIHVLHDTMATLTQITRKPLELGI